MNKLSNIPRRNYSLNFENCDSVRLDRLEKKVQKLDNLKRISTGWVLYLTIGSSYGIGTAIGDIISCFWKLKK